MKNSKKKVLSLFSVVIGSFLITGVASAATLASVTITGTAAVGSTLTAVPNAGTAQFHYQWYSSATSGGTYLPISGETATTTIPTGAYVGKFFKVSATTTLPDIGEATSSATTAITAKQLTIADPTLTLSKVYDGDRTAAVTAGALSGVVGGDTVTVSAVGTYDTATTTTGKTITVVYTLAGAQATGYTKPVDYTSTSGVVTAKQLTISDPTLTTTKNYDGNTSAAVTAGTLSGVVGADTVTVTAAGTYSNANVGTSRGITVVYTLAGADSVNYTKPVDYSVTTGVIVGAGAASAAYFAPAPTAPTTAPVVTTATTPVVTTPTLPKNPTQTDYQNLISTLLAQVSALQAQLPTATVSGTGYKFVSALAMGNSNDSVKQLQMFLKAQGSDIYPSGATTGYFGQLTQNAVKAFQVKYGLAKAGDTGYGFVGPKTRAKINQLQGM